MKVKLITVTLAVCISLISCKHKIEPQYPPNREDNKENIINEMLKKEVIYRIQTDRNFMMDGMIWYDPASKKYILDLSEPDAMSLGFTSQEYKQVQKRVKQMNTVDKEHL